LRPSARSSAWWIASGQLSKSRRPSASQLDIAVPPLAASLCTDSLAAFLVVSEARARLGLKELEPCSYLCGG
jgi:hypothetical protein